MVVVLFLTAIDGRLSVSVDTRFGMFYFRQCFVFPGDLGRGNLYYQEDSFIRVSLDYVVHIFNLRAYCDADWVGDSVTRKSTIGFCVFLGDSLISWKNIGVHITSPTSLYCDNRSAIQIACNTVFHERTYRD
ncbi:uncharacterized mitochondrial protein-like protein [Tanacetum coccineum]